MPQCNRCERIQSSAELRRTRLGWVCKENTKGTRCWSITRALKKAERARRREQQVAA